MEFKKKLLIVNKAQFGYHIDTYYYCKFLSNEYDITYFCFDEKKEKMVLDNVNVIYCPFNYKYFIRALVFFYLLANKYYHLKPNIVLIKYFTGSVFSLSFMKRSKIILDIRTGCVSSGLEKRKRKDKILKFETSFFKNITVISEGLKKHLNLKESAKVISLGSIQISPKEKNYESIKLLYVGTFENRKIEVTIESVAKFVKEISSNISYQIVGFGSNQDIELIKQTIKDNNLQSIVKFEGRVSVDSLQKYFDDNNTGVAYIPITDYYAHQPSTKMFEYAMSGLVNIATNTTINKTFITENNGILCDDNVDDFFNALKKVNNNLSSYNYHKIVNSLEDYHWENIIGNQLNPLLKKILDDAV
jgi:hypothetical protein